MNMKIATNQQKNEANYRKATLPFCTGDNKYLDSKKHESLEKNSQHLIALYNHFFI